MPVLQTRLRTARIAPERYALSVAGDLDADVAPTLRAKLAELVEGGATTIVIDLLETATIDADGVSVLVDLGKVLRSSRGELVLVADEPSVASLLTTSDDSRWFHVEPSLLKAVDHVVDGIA
jgi:anti-sigma B factor antagonist